jgi:hypothetical protein
MSNQQKLLLKSKSVGDFLLEQQRRDEWGAKQGEIRKQEFAEKRQEIVENCSLLRRKKTVVKKVTIEPKLDAWDKFRLARWSLKKPNGKPHPFMTDINIWEQIQGQTNQSLDYLYDIAYGNYRRGDITPDQWHAFENLIWNKGVPLDL